MALPNRPAGVLVRIACLLALVLTIATLTTVALASAPPAAAQATTQTTLRVEGMYCTGCEETVRSVLAGLDGVSRAQADIDTQTATVTYDPARVTPQQMVQAINTNTYYQASVFDGASPAGPAPMPPQNDGSIGVWAVVATLAVVLATSVFLVKQARRGRSATSGAPHDPGDS